MIVVVGGLKGGSGKTTLATNLTVMRSQTGKKVLLVDADEQKSTSFWASQRDALEIETKFTTIQLTGKSIHTQIKKMIGDYDDIIIDVGGRHTTSLRSSLAVADVFLTPFKPRSLDIWTIGEIKEVVAEMKTVNPEMKVFGIINQADSCGNDNIEAIEILNSSDDDISCLEITVGNRKAYGNAAAEGLGIIELKTQDKKAIEEMKNLYQSIYH